MSNRIDVDLGDRSYPVLIGENLLTDDTLWSPYVAGRRVLVVSDANVAPRYANRLVAALSAASEVDTVICPPGEQAKTLDMVATVFDRLSQLRAARDSVVIGLGGGVIGDLAGFAAACWMRGIRFVQAPTTLLAMVDSSVGGKTGVNLPHGKNLVGAFHQPAAVVADISTLATLPDRELRAGMAEVVKYAALGDAALFDWLESRADRLFARDADALAQAIAACVRHKAGIVARDEHEHGERALLNFGHTFGHAIETATGYERYLHGEAVAIGMIQAARLSERLGLASRADGDRLGKLLQRLALPVAVDPPIDGGRLLDHMRLDKKATAGGLRFILWHGIGRAQIVSGVNDADVMFALDG